MAAVKRRRERRTSQPREAAKQLDGTDSVGDVMGNYDSGRRRSARLKGKLATRGGNLKECTSTGKRRTGRSQRRIVSDGPAKKIAKVSRQLSRGQRISMDVQAAGES